MIDEVQSVIEKWQSDERLTSLGEAKVQQVIVLPILRRLGWDPDNDHEVHPQYPVADGWVDYALLIGNAPKVFIEVKKGGESLERHQEQLLNYSFKQGVKLAVLTNGATWWFYLPLQEGSWEQRKFHAAEFDKQNTAEIAQIFANLLSKENVSSGKAIENAEDLYKRHQIAEALPEAWGQLVDDTIANLLTIRTEALCGHKPDKNEVNQFLSKMRLPQKTSHPSVPEPVPVPVSIPTPEPAPAPKPRDSDSSMKGKQVRGFTFLGTKYEVTSWRNILVNICEILHRTHGDRFWKVLKLRGRSKPYFSRNPTDDGLREPKQIIGTDIYVDVNLNADQVVQRAKDVLTHLGYSESDLQIEDN